MAVLGGLIAGPALLITGFIMGAKASANLDNAYSNRSEARKLAEELDTGVSMCMGIVKVSALYANMLASYDEIFKPLVEKLTNIVSTKGTDFSQYTLDEKKVVAKSAALAKTIKTLIDVPILNQDGALEDDTVNTANNFAEKFSEYAV